jgi:hypothetical protein
MKLLSSSSSIAERSFNGLVTGAFPRTPSILELRAKTGAFFSLNSTPGRADK